MRRAASFSVLHASHLWEPTVFITMHRALNTADRTGGGIFAVRRPRPYSRAFAGMALRSKCGHCRLHAHTMPHVETLILYNDAARRVATVFEKWNCKIKTVLPSRKGNPP